jgi:AraC family transcriptional regulator of adaptative response / DNA-3-methyladenine glycosylase II
VLTTGIYCRPICPAPIPQFKNVRFFACAAAAEQAGLRPCKRCRPDAAPGTPAWLGTSATVARALRLISDGFLDDAGVDELARCVGVGERQLRRLFAVHLGAAPNVMAQTRRVHFARKLIDETDLPMIEVAASAGFGSLRQFNSAVRATFGASPFELRRTQRRNSAAALNGEVALRLPFRPPFDWNSLIAFLGARAIPGVEAVTASSYRRTIAVHGSTGVIDVRPVDGKSHLLLRVQLSQPKKLMHIVERVRQLFDLSADPLQISDHLRSDTRLRAIIARHPGLRVPGAWDGFELAVRAILGQQVSVKGATTLSGRLIRQFGATLPLIESQPLTHLFPKPETLAGADLTSIGIPSTRARTIRELARAAANGELTLDTPTEIEETGSCLANLTGVGPWTTQYIAMRALHEPDAFPASDLGLRKAISNGEATMTGAQLERLAKAWRPWRAYAAMHLWRSLTKE